MRHNSIIYLFPLDHVARSHQQQHVPMKYSPSSWYPYISISANPLNKISTRREFLRSLLLLTPILSKESSICLQWQFNQIFYIWRVDSGSYQMNGGGGCPEQQFIYYFWNYLWLLNVKAWSQKMHFYRW